MDDRAVSEYQRKSKELVVFSRLAEQVVTVSWPKFHGHKIRDTGIKAFLRTRGLFIECFCGFCSESNQPRSCQIVVSKVTNHTHGFCHYDSPRCRFHVNFTEIYTTSLLTSSYADLPTLQSGNNPDMGSLLVAFTLHQFPPQEIAPHFEAYLGEHISSYPDGTQQLSGPFLLRRPSNPRPVARGRVSSPYTRFQKQLPASNDHYLEINDVYPRHEVQTAPARLQARNAVAGPSRIPLGSTPHPAPFPLELHTTNDKDAKFLQKLIQGDGISEDAWDGLIVTPLGGIKERILGAHRAQITKVILPWANSKDVEHDVALEIRSIMEFVFVRTVNEALVARRRCKSQCSPSKLYGLEWRW
ncbi:hypothetical protein DFH09DRAFT_1315076 [Mycena vulgaris]|nr:hypothetical protein DFH09DRAFT_1315076 [Mycena vulgaris]